MIPAMWTSLDYASPGYKRPGYPCLLNVSLLALPWC